jgi:hypothetical protein
MIENRSNMFSSKEGERPGVVDMNIVQRVEFLIPGGCINENDPVELQGRTIEQLARDVKPSVIGIRTFRRVEGTVIVDGKSMRVSSSKFDLSGTTYIDGEIMNANLVKRSIPDSESLVYNMEQSGWDWVIRTRSGNIEPFMANDRNIYLPKKSQEK